MSWLTTNRYHTRLNLNKRPTQPQGKNILKSNNTGSQKVVFLRTLRVVWPLAVLLTPVLQVFLLWAYNKYGHPWKDILAKVRVDKVKPIFHILNIDNNLTVLDGRSCGGSTEN